MNQFLENLKGRIENMVVYRLPDGQMCVRGKSMTPRDAQSPLQLAQRDRFRDVQARASALKEFLRDHFARINPNGSGYHTFIKVNMARQNGQDVADLLAEARYDTYTRGALWNGALFVNAATSGPSTGGSPEVDFHWSDDRKHAKPHDDDLLQILHLNPATLDWWVFDTGATRAGQAAYLHSPTPPEEGELLLIPFFRSPDGTDCSTSTPLAYVTTEGTLEIL